MASFDPEAVTPQTPKSMKDSSSSKKTASTKSLKKKPRGSEKRKKELANSPPAETQALAQDSGSSEDETKEPQPQISPHTQDGDDSEPLPPEEELRIKEIKQKEVDLILLSLQKEIANQTLAATPASPKDPDQEKAKAKESKEKKTEKVKEKKEVFPYSLRPTRPPNQLESPIFKPPQVIINGTRDRVAMEILTTEISYVKSLIILNTIFKDPIAEKIEQGTAFLTEAQFHAIFGNIEDLLTLNLDFLTTLSERLSAWSPAQQLGDVFMKLVPWLRFYTTYSLQFQSGTKLVTELDKKEKVHTFLDQQAEHPLCQGLDFAAFLIMPIQRIPRYNLLAKELLAHTPSDHPDHKNLTSALEALKDLAVQINEAVREAERQARLNKIARKFIDHRESEIRKEGRHFYHDGALTKVNRKGTKMKVRHFFLFSDCLMYANIQPNNRYSLARSLPLDSLSISDAPSTPEIKHPFNILHKERSFQVFCETPIEKTQWFQAFDHALGTDNKDKDVAPVWVSDSLCKTCTVCDVKFTFTNRRHHCRQCGIVVCGECSNNKKYMPGKGKKVRVCTKCMKDGETEEKGGSGSEDGSDSSGVDFLFEVKARYDYSPTGNTNSILLGFKGGDVLGILLVNPNGWWLAELNGSRGWVPASFLSAPPEEFLVVQKEIALSTQVAVSGEA